MSLKHKEVAFDTVFDSYIAQFLYWENSYDLQAFRVLKASLKGIEERNCFALFGVRIKMGSQSHWIPKGLEFFLYATDYWWAFICVGMCRTQSLKAYRFIKLNWRIC